MLGFLGAGHVGERHGIPVTGRHRCFPDLIHHHDGGHTVAQIVNLPQRLCAGICRERRHSQGQAHDCGQHHRRQFFEHCNQPSFLFLYVLRTSEQFDSALTPFARRGRRQVFTVIVSSMVSHAPPEYTCAVTSIT